MVTAHDGDDLLLRASRRAPRGWSEDERDGNAGEDDPGAARGVGRRPRGRPAAGAAACGAGQGGLRHDLTARERDILKLLAQGRSTSAMAGTLFMATATARNHVQSIMTKLGAPSSLEAVAIALRENIIRAA